MEHLLGLLRIRVQRGRNLAVRDFRSSDPYIVVKMGKQKLKTRVVKKSVNPEWNEDLTLSISDSSHPIHIAVYDKDTFTQDDKMGDAEIEIGPFLEAIRMRLDGVANGMVASRVEPSKENCLAEQSCIIYSDGNIIQNMTVRLRNVESGEVELQLQWINIPGSRVKGIFTFFSVMEIIKFMDNLSISQIEVESDALNVVHALNSFESDLRMEGPIFDEIRLLKNEFQAAQWKKIPRSSNKVAHQLAKEAVKFGGIKFWKEIGPM
ncbi:hypothetical protein ACLB2K_007244 [Fragaria x ananassa]